MKVKYNEVMGAIIEYFNDELDTIYYGEVTCGTQEPQPEEFGRAFIKMEYGDKFDETGKYGTTPQMEVNWNIQMIICCNESDIHDSKVQAWGVLEQLEEIIRGDIKLGSIQNLMRAIPGDARGEMHQGSEYRLTLELLTRWQIH